MVNKVATTLGKSHREASSTCFLDGFPRNSGDELCKNGDWQGTVGALYGGDNMMAAIEPEHSGGVVTASLGTSGTLFAFSVPIIDPQGRHFVISTTTGCR
jgi:hypothetical protein